MNTPPPAGKVHVVDDEDTVVRSIALLLESAGLAAVQWTSPLDFLARGDLAPPCCVLLDVQMPGRSGPEVQDALRARGLEVPVLFLTAHGDVPTTVRTMKAGAVEFLLKPPDPVALLEAVRGALRQSEADAAAATWRDGVRRRYDGLTPREREVLRRIVLGATNREGADALGVSENTLKTHRLRVMEKMRAESLAELVRMAVALDVVPLEPPAGP